MYCDVNFKSKKALKEAVASGKKIGFFQPGPFGGREPTQGRIVLQGPHYPAAHTWYATADVVNGLIVKVR